MKTAAWRKQSRITAVLIGLALAVATPAAIGQTNPLVWQDVPFDRDSGILSNDGAGRQVKLLYSTVVRMPGAAWIRLRFGDVRISGSMRETQRSFLVVTSLQDGGDQVLHLSSLRDWRHMSAYFNGEAVRVELFAAPQTGDARVEIVGVWAGEPNPPGGGGLISTQCGPTDDRVPSNDPRTGRLIPLGCTGFLIADGTDSCALTAGHCQNPLGANDTLEFNVPPSNADGSINFADPDDQYAIDLTSIQSFDDGPGLIGNDWCYFGTFVNTNTGLFPRVAQDVAGFNVPGAQPVVDNTTIDNWGFGTDSNQATRSQTQQFDSGSYDLADAASVFYNDIDTEGGSSGSPVLKVSTNQVVAIHTNAGCNTDGTGNNSGTRIDNAGLQNALANPIGICAGPFCGDAAAGSCYEVNGNQGCNNTACCQTVCAADVFCCNVNWDSLCVDQAFELCGDCGAPAAGDCCVSNGSPGCNDTVCCESVCLADPFCCNSVWDGICVSQALSVCAVCQTGACCFGDFPNQSCTDAITALECAAAGGVYQGDDTTCDAAGCVDLCPGEGSCYEPNGTPGCNDAACCKTVCAADAFCCNVEWDSLCVDQAFELCGGCGAPAAGDCCVSNGSPGCNDTVCCESVCLADPFCCNVTWDSICTGVAEDLCGVLCSTGACCFGDFPNQSCTDAITALECAAAGGVYQGDDTTCAAVGCADLCPGEGNCFEPNGTPGCNDTFCCKAVCTADPFCCNTGWDQLCADAAQRLCGNAACPGTGGCAGPNGTPGCEDPVCCKTVCLVDPFCCSTAWDGLCATEAHQLCDLTCPWDCGDGDGNVGINDFLSLLAQWGGPGSCDFSGTGVGINDFLKLLANWGDCPAAADCEVPGVCGNFETCAGNPACSCFTLADGSPFCGAGVPCAGALECVDGTCPPGFVCQVLTCCEVDICAPVETECGGAAAAVYPPGTHTTAGVVPE